MRNDMNLMRKGALADTREKLSALEIKAEGLCKLIANAVFMYDGIKSIDIEAAEQSVSELKETLVDYARLEKQLRKLEGE